MEIASVSQKFFGQKISQDVRYRSREANVLKLGVHPMPRCFIHQYSVLGEVNRHVTTISGVFQVRDYL